MSTPAVSAAGPRWRALGPAVLFAALVVVVYANPLFVRRNFTGRDLIAYNLPMEKVIHDAWARGRLPVWNADVSGGRPLMPNPNAGALYPVRAALGVVPFPLAMRIAPLLHWIAAGIGMLLLLRALKRSREASLLGAVTYAFAGVSVAEVFFPHIQPGMTLLPWIVWAIARPAAAPWRRVLPLSILFGLDFLAGDVFTGALAVGSAALWIATEDLSAVRGRALGALAAGVGLGALAAAPQIVATALWIPLTNRAVLGLPFSDTIYFSIHPLRLLELVIPYPFGDSWEMTHGAVWGWGLFRGRPMGIFNTLYCGSFAVMAVVFTWRRSDRGTRFARWLLGLTLALAVPPALIPFAWALKVPSPISLRNPEKLAVALGLALAILAAVAWDALATEPARRRRWPLVTGGVLTLASAAAWLMPAAAGRAAIGILGGNPAVLVPRAQASLPGALAVAGLLWMAAVVAVDVLASRRPRSAALALALVAAAPILANRPIARTLREEAVLGPTAFARYVARRDPAGEYRTLGESLFLGASDMLLRATDGTMLYSDFSPRTWTHHTASLWGRGTVINEDFDVGDLSRTESLRKVSGFATGFLDSQAFFGSLALRFGIRFKDQTTPIAGFHKVGGDALQDWDERSDAYPDIRMLERWEERPTAVAALEALPRLPAGAVVIEGLGDRSGAAPPAELRVLEKTPERMALEVDARKPAWLFVLRAFWPFRDVEVDGRRVEASPAQLAFSAVAVPAGKHRIDWIERVPGFEISRFGPILFGIAAIWLAAAASRRETETAPE